MIPGRLLDAPTGPSDRIVQAYWLLAGASTVLSIAFANETLMLLTILLFGVPHGALDGEMARERLHARWGVAWFPLFGLPYLAAIALVIAAWQIWPYATLTAFLVLSLCHFGAETAETHRPLLSAFVLGGAPLILPACLHPAQTATLLDGMIAPHALHVPPPWMTDLMPVWTVGALLWLARADRYVVVTVFLPVLLVFWLLPPLPAFMLYFIFIHAPAHIDGLTASDKWPRLTSQRDALKRAIPLSLLTAIIAFGLWPLYAGPPVSRLLQLTFQLLAALTLPHMVFDMLITRNSPVIRGGSARRRSVSGGIGRL